MNLQQIQREAIIKNLEQAKRSYGVRLPNPIFQFQRDRSLQAQTLMVDTINAFNDVRIQIKEL